MLLLRPTWRYYRKMFKNLKETTCGWKSRSSIGFMDLCLVSQRIASYSLKLSIDSFVKFLIKQNASVWQSWTKSLKNINMSDSFFSQRYQYFAWVDLEHLKNIFAHFTLNFCLYYVTWMSQTVCIPWEIMFAQYRVYNSVIVVLQSQFEYDGHNTH